MSAPLLYFWRNVATLVCSPLKPHEQSLEDGLNVLMLAQLNAYKHHDPFATPAAWSNAHSSALSVLGWTNTANTSRHVTPARPFTLASHVSSQFTQGAALALPSTIAATTDEQADKIRLFSVRQVGTRFDLHLSHASLPQPYRIEMLSVAFSVRTQPTRRWLSQPYTLEQGAHEVAVRHSCFQTDEQTYAQYREKVQTASSKYRAAELEAFG